VLLARAEVAMAVAPHFDFDFVIIGFGGLVAALRLSEKDHRVPVLENGKRLAGATRDEADPRGAALIVAIEIT
jgi:choline dehydrogenase-like flavoprotein